MEECHGYPQSTKDCHVLPHQNNMCIWRYLGVYCATTVHLQTIFRDSHGHHKFVNELPPFLGGKQDEEGSVFSYIGYTLFYQVWLDGHSRTQISGFETPRDLASLNDWFILVNDG